MKAPEILELCRRVLAGDAEQIVLARDEAHMLAWLSEWKVGSLRALWDEFPLREADYDYFERMRRKEP